MDELLFIRPADLSDHQYLVQWLSQPGVLRGFPLTDVREIEDAARIWLSYMKFGAVLTAVYDGIPCGIANLYIQPYKKLAHQALFAIVIDESFRGKGIGTRLLSELFELAKDKFHMEFIHLEVYEGNPAIRLYERFGFVQYGVHHRFIKDDEGYKSKIMMQKKL